MTAPLKVHSPYPDPDPDTNNPHVGMRVLGAMQINIGILVFVLGLADLILTMTSHDSDLERYGPRYQLVVTMTVVSSPLWCGLWFSITGTLGACFPCYNSTTLHYSEVGLLVTSLLCCALFGPVCALISAFISYTRHNLASTDHQWLVSLVVCFLAVIQVVLATVSASVTCCCSTFRSTQVHVFVNPRKLSRRGSHVSTATKSPSIMSDRFRRILSRMAVSNFSRQGTNMVANLPYQKHVEGNSAVLPRNVKDVGNQVPRGRTRSVNIGTSDIDLVHNNHQSQGGDPNDGVKHSKFIPVGDNNQALPKSSLPKVNNVHETGSLPQLREDVVKSSEERSFSQPPNTSVREVIMRTPRQWRPLEADNNSIHDPPDRIHQTSLKNDGHRRSPQPKWTTEKGARGNIPAQRVSWTPDRHLRNLRPPLDARPWSTDQLLLDTGQSSSYLALKKWALPR